MRTNRLNVGSKADFMDCVAFVSKVLERAKGIEPSYEAWEASVLPLNYARNRSPVIFFAPNLLRLLTYRAIFRKSMAPR
jgi:hypothetical protein